jgi:hypothetical protein
MASPFRVTDVTVDALEVLRHCGTELYAAIPMLAIVS